MGSTLCSSVIIKFVALYQKHLYCFTLLWRSEVLMITWITWLIGLSLRLLMTGPGNSLKVHTTTFWHDHRSKFKQQTDVCNTDENLFLLSYTHICDAAACVILGGICVLKIHHTNSFHQHNEEAYCLQNRLDMWCVRKINYGTSRSKTKS